MLFRSPKSDMNPTFNKCYNSGNCENRHNSAIISKNCHVKLPTGKNTIQLCESGLITAKENKVCRPTTDLKEPELIDKEMQPDCLIDNPPKNEIDSHKKDSYNKSMNNNSNTLKSKQSIKPKSHPKEKKIPNAGTTSSKHSKKEINSKNISEIHANAKAKESKQKSDKRFDPTKELNNELKIFSDGILNIIKPEIEEIIKSNGQIDSKYKNTPKVVFDSSNSVLENKKIASKKYQKLDIIGKEAFSRVFKIMHIETKKIYAMKAINKIVCLEPGEVSNEIDIMKSLVSFLILQSRIILT